MGQLRECLGGEKMTKSEKEKQLFFKARREQSTPVERRVERLGAGQDGPSHPCPEYLPSSGRAAHSFFFTGPFACHPVLHHHIDNFDVHHVHFGDHHHHLDHPVHPGAFPLPLLCL